MRQKLDWNRGKLNKAAYCRGIRGAVFHNDIAVLRGDLGRAGIPVMP